MLTAVDKVSSLRYLVLNLCWMLTNLVWEPNILNSIVHKYPWHFSIHPKAFMCTQWRPVTGLNRPINSRRLLRNNMPDFCGSLPLRSIRDIDIFAFNSQNDGKIVTSLFQSLSTHITSWLLNEKSVQLCIFIQKIHYFPSYFHVNLYDLFKFLFFLSIILLNFKCIQSTKYTPL